jgi:hypothetical protein
MADAGSTQTIEPPTTERRMTGRSVGVVVCVVLAVLLTTPALVAYWGQRTLNDTQRASLADQARVRLHAAA